MHSTLYTLMYTFLWGTRSQWLCVFVLLGMCVWVFEYELHWQPSSPYTHLHCKTIDLGQGWESFSCLLKPWLYWVAGFASPFHTINLLEGFFRVRSCFHNSDPNLFLGTLRLWFGEQQGALSFVRIMFSPFKKKNKHGNELFYSMSHIRCWNPFHRTHGLICTGILSNNYKKLFCYSKSRSLRQDGKWCFLHYWQWKTTPCLGKQ